MKELLQHCENVAETLAEVNVGGVPGLVQMELQVPFVSKLAWPAIAEAARTKVAIRTEARSGAFIGIS
ncbi:MAG TPA: hypothetical protein VIE43_13805, partial [Thermoanaerobaculia bacterium]|nr:hypothetical protein [Thermoanaerobaculia bacterium]